MPDGQGTTPGSDRRRRQRQRVHIPVSVQSASGLVEGYTENLTPFGALIHADGPLPAVGEECGLKFGLAGGAACARGRVVRADRRRKGIAVEITHLDSRGELLLVELLRIEGDLP